MRIDLKTIHKGKEMNNTVEVYVLESLNGQLLYHSKKEHMLFLDREDAEKALSGKNEMKWGQNWSVATIILQKNLSSRPFKFWAPKKADMIPLFKGAMWLTDLRDLVAEKDPKTMEKIKPSVSEMRVLINKKMEARKIAEQEAIDASEATVEEKAKAEEFDKDALIATLRNTLKELGGNAGNLRDPEKLQKRIEAMYETV